MYGIDTQHLENQGSVCQSGKRDLLTTGKVRLQVGPNISLYIYFWRRLGAIDLIALLVRFKIMAD